MASHTGIPKTTLHCLVKQGKLKIQQRKMKPKLNKKSKWQRVQYCLSEGGANGFYGDMEDRVHIDEKWFYLSKVTASYYSVEGEDNTTIFIVKIGKIIDTFSPQNPSQN